MNFTLAEAFPLLPTILFVLAVVFVPFLSKVSIWYGTLVHEVGHGIVAVPFLGRIGGIKLTANGAGHATTVYSALLYHPVRIISLLMGYAFPVYVGMVLLICTYYHNVILGGWVLGTIGVLLIISIRNWFGLLIVLSYSGIFITYFVANTFLNPLNLMFVAGLMFLLRGLTDILVLAPNIFHRTGVFDVDNPTDFDFLEQEFKLPRQLWYSFFILFHGAVVFVILAAFPITFS